MEAQLTFRKYQDALAENRLTGQFCKSCGTVSIPPQAACRNCAGTQFDIRDIEKKGIIRTFTVIRVAAEGMTPPLIVALVETTSGAWLMGNIEGVDPDAATMELIGKNVSISSGLIKGDLFAHRDVWTPVFRIDD